MTGELNGSKGNQLVVLGGGVAGVCCAQELCRICPDAHVTLISADAVVKVARKPKPHAQHSGCIRLNNLKDVSCMLSVHRLD